MRTRVLPLILACLAACAPSARPEPAPAPARLADTEVPPVRALLSEREQLSLTPAQVVALDSIALDWQAAHDALAARFTGPARLLAAVRSHPRLALAENNRRAARAVEQLLTPDQRLAACRAQGMMRGAKAGPGGDPVPQEAGMLKKQALALSLKPRPERRRAERRTAWPWCGTAPDAPTESHSAH